MFQVPGFQPDLISFGKRFETSSGTRAHDLSCKFMSGESFVAGGRESFEVSFYCGDRGIKDHRGKGTGFISHHEIERGLVCNGVRAVIMSEFCVGD